MTRNPTTEKDTTTVTSTGDITHATDVDQPHGNTTRAASIRLVPLGRMNVTPAAQRKYQPQHARDMADDFDLEGMGYPVLNFRDSVWWVVDGQHRVAALRILGFGDDDVIECECYFGLTQKQEADLFLRRARSKAIHVIDKFRIGVTAGWDEETAIQKIVDELGLKIGFGAGKIAAVGTLRRLYVEGGAAGLGRTLLIVREAYGEEGFSASMISGVGAVIQRYKNNVDTARLVTALTKAAGSAAGIEQKADVLQRSTGNSKAICVGAAIVQTYNRTKGRKLTDWWKTSSEEE